MFFGTPLRWVVQIEILKFWKGVFSKKIIFDMFENKTNDNLKSWQFESVCFLFVFSNTKN